jgi:hypothetical protein
MVSLIMLQDVQKNIPNFVVSPGMPRAGSTTLYHSLEHHPALFLPIRKEMFFFSVFYNRGINWFLEYYRHAKSEQVCVDVSPDYFHHDHAIARIKQFNPDTKVILCVRDPLEWVFSLYNEVDMFDFGLPDFKEFLQGYTISHGEKKVSIELQNNAISRRIKEYQEAFGDNLLLYSFALFKRDLLSVLQSIESFVQIPSYFNSGNLDTMAFNASNRRNNKLLYHLIYHEKFIALLLKIFPDTLLRNFRRQYYRVAAKSKAAAPRVTYSQEDIRLAEELLSDDRKFITDLFADHEMQSGTGLPFP